MTMFEVHVEGELGVPTLHSLGCTHCVTQAQTSMRVEATPAELHRLLQECTDHDLTIESVVRLETSQKSRAGDPALPHLSTDRAPDPDGPRRLDG
jgi:hypothetical protein